MTDLDSTKEQAFFPSQHPEKNPAVAPSWKPLLWLAGGLTVLIVLGEVFFDVLLEGLELLGEVIFFAVEGSEEHLEDKIEEWFDLDPYHAEIVTAWTMTPFKILLAIFVLRWLWRRAHGKLFPRIAAYIKRQYTAVRLAWQLLAWPFKILAVAAALGGLLILI
jgi:hypothetical protein